MASISNQAPYMLSFRRGEVEEHRRLNSQHEVIKYGIANGQLIDPLIPVKNTHYAIADICCGTGVWLEDVANTVFASEHTAEGKSYELIGFDTDAHAFKTSAAGIQLIEQDCTMPFDTKYHGRFDLVNMRGLAYAIPEEKFPLLISNAVQLLRPDGYLQWLETDTRLFQTHTDSPEVLKALKIINIERQERKLVPYMPHFMLRALLNLDTKKDFAQLSPSEDAMSIVNFSLVPGGLSRVSQSNDDAVNEKFSEIVLETVQLLLKSSLLRTASQEHGDGSTDSLQRLMDLIDENRESGRIKMGGRFPLLIAQRSAGQQSGGQFHHIG